MSRIYKSGEQKNRYTGVDKSVRYNPVQAASSERQLRDYKQAVIQDSQTVARELARAQKQEQLEQELQQRAESSALKVGQQQETFSLARDQLYDKSVLEKEQLHAKLVMGLESSELKAKNAADNARLRVTGDAIQGLLKFGGSVLQYQAEQAKIDEQNKIWDFEMEAAGLGSTFGSEDPISADNVGSS